MTPVEYTIPAGQAYVATGPIQSDYYWAPTYTLDPADHVVVKGATQLLPDPPWPPLLLRERRRRGRPPRLGGLSRRARAAARAVLSPRAAA